MGIFVAFILVIAALLAVQVVRLLFADSDLVLQWALLFGKQPSSLKGKVVWITGASSGIGEYLAYELSKAGCKLVLSARRVKELEEVKLKCHDKGARESDILVLPLDMTKYETHKAAVDKVLDCFNKVDILVNNAARSQRARFHEIDIEVDRDLYNVNVFGPISLTRAILPHMMERKTGHIVLTSSFSGKFGAGYSSTYTATKHALHGAFESLRIEMNSYNIAVTMLCPGPVRSEILLHAATKTPGQKLNSTQNFTTNVMETERCAYLSAVAISNQLDETWIGNQPVLFVMYIIQYAPTYARRLLKNFGPKLMKLPKDM